MNSRTQGREGRTSPALQAKIRNARAKPVSTNIVRIYLIIYNALSAVAWAAFANQVYETFKSSDLAAIPSRTIKTLCIVQTLALLEVLHVILGLVPSQLFSTVMQIASRLFITWVPGYYFITSSAASPLKKWGYLAIIVAWTLSDLTRYIYYTLNLFGINGGPLLWCRYTFFLVLYPIGTVGEVIMIWAMRSGLVASGQTGHYRHVLAVMMIIYPLGFVYMYNHMLKQRKKYIR